MAATKLPVPIDEITEAKAVELGLKLYQAPGALNVYLKHIRAEATSEVPDLTTKKGRDRIASLSANVSRSKVAIEKPGRAYLKYLKESVKPVEQHLKHFTDECDKLRDEVRKPLTNWEADQKAKVERLNAMVADFAEQVTSLRLELASVPMAEREQLIIDVLADVEAMPVDESFEQMQEAAAEAKAKAIADLKQLKEVAIIEAERERKAAEAAEAERQRQIKEAADKAAAEAKAKAEAEAQAAIERAQREKQEAEDRAVREKQEAEANAKRAAEQAAAEERQRIEAEQRARDEAERLEREAAERKAKDKAHRATINNDILARLVALGIDDASAKTIITAAAKGELGAMFIDY